MSNNGEGKVAEIEAIFVKKIETLEILIRFGDSDEEIFGYGLEIALSFYNPRGIS